MDLGEAGDRANHQKQPSSNPLMAGQCIKVGSCMIALVFDWDDTCIDALVDQSSLSPSPNRIQIVEKAGSAGRSFNGLSAERGA